MADFLKSTASKVTVGVVSLAVVAGGISWFQAAPADRQHVVAMTERCFGWLVLVLAIPWLSFALVSWIARQDSNAWSAALIVLMTALEAAGLAWLFSFSIHGPGAWSVYLASIAVAGVYNLLACDWIAEKF